jgi:hypothetical protein
MATRNYEHGIEESAAYGKRIIAPFFLSDIFVNGMNCGHIALSHCFQSQE